MPSESDSKMHEPLRAYARHRRAEAGEPSLHPATRRLLQGEVARTYASERERATGPGAGRNFWRAWWPRWALAGSLAALTATVAWFVAQPRFAGEKGLTLAKDTAAEEGRELRESERVATAPAANAANRSAAPTPAQPREVDLAARSPAPIESASANRKPALSRADTADVQRRRVEADAPSKELKAEAAFDATRSQARRDSSAAAATPAPILSVPPSPTKEFSVATTTGDGSVLARDPTTPLNSVVRSFEAGARSAQLALTTNQSVASLNLQFSRVAALEPATKLRLAGERDASRGVVESAPVLRSFDLENVGNRWLIRDADGSTYEGDTLPESLGAAQGVTVPASSARQNTQAAQATRFRVSGTNRTLNQLVVFDGRVAQTLAVSAQNASSSVGAAVATATALADEKLADAQAAPNVPALTRQQQALEQRATTQNVPVQLEGTLRIGTNETPLRALQRQGP